MVISFVVRFVFSVWLLLHTCS